MPRLPNALTALPPIATEALKKLGENLALARVRRKESQRVWAKRMCCPPDKRSAISKCG